MTITSYTGQEAAQVARLYHASVHAICSDLYTLKQIEAWAPTPPELDFWRERLARSQPHLCWINDKLAGFIELEDRGHIHCLYTTPNTKDVASRQHCTNMPKILLLSKLVKPLLSMHPKLQGDSL